MQLHRRAAGRRLRPVGPLLALALLAGCGGADTEGDAGASEEPAVQETVGAGAGSEAAGEGTVDDGVNPVLDLDFPDPDLLRVGDTYYAYATNANNRNVRVARSSDLVEWELLRDDALPRLPSFVIPGKTWAPEVTQLAPDRFAMYYTATNFQPTFQCIGVAMSTTPEGPFEPVGEAMLVCPEEEGGAIDASTFLDEDGTLYLLWKNDGNCCALDTWLQIAPLSPDGTTLAGPPVRLVKQDQVWEGNLVEAPTVVLRDDTYVLLYSANDYGGGEYTIGYATAPEVLGPYTKAPDPLLTTEDTSGEYIGPGGQDVVVGPEGEDLLVFHSWYGQNSYRAMNVLPVDFRDGVPVVEVP